MVRHDRMCMTMKGSYSRLSYNTNDGDSATWNQYGGTSVTLNADLRSRMATKDLIQLSWVIGHGSGSKARLVNQQSLSLLTVRVKIPTV